MSESVEARLENAIMRNATDTAVSLRLSFLIELQRHMLTLTERLDEARELRLALLSDVSEVLVDHQRGALPNVDQVVARLTEIVEPLTED